MKAIQVRREGEKIDLIWTEIEDLEPGPTQVLIDVHAAGVNRADLFQARGFYPPPPDESDVLGLEVAGTVVSVGSNVTGWSTSDHVLALVPGGGYAEQCVIHQDMLLPLPADWSFLAGAAIPEAWLTAFSNLFLEGRLESTDKVLVHAGASGVGTAAIQLAKSVGAWVAATAGTDAKCRACRELGADLVINYRSEPIRQMLSGRTIDLILDCVGAPYLETHLEIFNTGGRLVLIGVMGGRTAKIDLATVLMKSLRIQGTRLRARSLDDKIRITRDFRKRFWSLLESNRLKPVIDRAFPMNRANDAHRYLRENRNIGKVILTLDRYIP